VVIDIASRLRFETELFERRARTSIGASELSEMMCDAQAETYGDGLDLDTRHPYMWLLKPHYYGAHFYNWPYTFGLLFGLGLFSTYQLDPERFRQSYDDLLSHAGIDDAETLAARFDLDVTERTFWEASLDVLRARIDDYVALVDERARTPAR
jgi:oligoendopeptidase F